MKSRELLLEELKHCFRMNDITYKKYIVDKKYLYALILKKYNLRIQELIVDLSAFLPNDYQIGCMELCHHLDVWLVLFEELEKEKSYCTGSVFFFQNNVNFPADFVERIIEFDF